MNATADRPLVRTPNPGDWMTCGAAAHALGVDKATVTRMISVGLLTVHRPNGHPDGERVQLLLWAEEVEELRRARARAKAPRDG